MISNLVGNKSKLPGEIRILLALVFSIISNPIFPQHFSSLYYDNRPNMLFGSIKEQEGNYYVTGVTTTVDTFSVDTLLYEKALFGKIYGNGNLDSIEVVADSDQWTYAIFQNCLKKTMDGNFIATGYKIDSVYKVFIMKTDTSGRMLLWKEYSYPNSVYFQGMDIAEVPNEGYLVAIDNFSNNSSNVVILRTDTAGNELNEKLYRINDQEIPNVIRPMSNGNYMIGAFTQKDDYNTPYWARTWLIEIDSMGNMVRDWLDDDSTNLWPNGMQQTADSGWIIVRPHLDYDVNDFQAFNASILKIDKNFNKQWEIDTGGDAPDGGLYDVGILPDGNYICSGANPINITQDSSHIYGWFVKVSSTGQILWQTTYLADSHYGTSCYLYSVNILSNGDLLSCGELDFTYNVGINPIQQAWILRTDSNGCEMENCLTGIEAIPKNTSNVTIYPNPASSQLIIFANDFEPQTITIYNLNGQPACAAGRQLINLPFAQEIDISTLAAGVYFVEVTGAQATEVRKLVKL